MASQDGLYALGGGGYSIRPLTWHHQTVWDQIAWEHAEEVIIKDDPTTKTIWVRFFRIDNRRVMFGLNYFRGLSWDKVDFSWFFFGADETNHDVSLIELVKNPTKNVLELWAANFTANAPIKIMRKKSKAAGDVNLYRDGAEGIGSTYRTGKIPPGFQQEMLEFLGWMARVTGVGTLSVSSFTLDFERTKVLPDKSLSLVPGKWVYGLLDHQSEGLHLEFSNKGRVDQWFSLQHVRVFYQKFVGIR